MASVGLDRRTLGRSAGQRDLIALVTRHRRRFEWYDALVTENGECDLPRLACLPLVDEALLLKHYYDAAHGDLRDAHSYQTSGTSTGRRKTILYSAADHASYCRQRGQLFARFLRAVPPGSLAVSDVGTGHAAASATTIFHRIGLTPYEIDFRRPVDEHVALLNESQPAVLFTMPVILDQMLVCRDHLDIHPRKVIVVGDVAPRNWRQHVAQTFDIGVNDVLDIVGSIEVGAIAYHCAGTGLYHFHEHILPEAVDAGVVFPDCGATLDADQGLLVLTSFTREYFPAVRYATNDVVRGLRRVHWQGRDVFVCERFEGRFAGDVKHGERLSSYDICAAVNEVFPGHLFEIVERGGLEIRIATERVTPEQQAAVANLLTSANPAVGSMVRAGLVRPIAVSAIPPGELRSRCGKRFVE
jgi:phenylacetate-coenzyme A ligase PaaK-like adenylate-forming protein